MSDDNESTPTSLGDLSTSQLETLIALKKLPDDNEVKIALYKALSLDDPATIRKKLKRENQPYYKEEYARLFLPVLDGMLRDKKTKQLLQRDYPQYSIATIELRIRQSINYIEDNLDLDGKYKKLMLSYEIRKEKDRVLFQYMGGMTLEQEIIVHDVIDQSSFEDVKAEVMKFLDEGLIGEKLTLPHKDFPEFILKEEELRELRTICKEMTKFGVTYMLDDNNIIIGKVKPD